MAAVSNSPLRHKREPRQRVRVLAADEHADPAQLRAADTQPAAAAVRADELFVEGRHEFAAMVQEGAVGADQHIRVPQAADAGRCALGDADGDEDPVAPRRLAEECQLGPIDRDGGGGEPLEPLMRPDRRLDAAQTGNPGRNATGKAISLAPLAKSQDDPTLGRQSGAHPVRMSKT